jgi:hypothetical protein
MATVAGRQVDAEAAIRIEIAMHKVENGNAGSKEMDS